MGPAITSTYTGAIPAYTGGIGAIPPYGGGLGGIGGIGAIPPYQAGIPAIPPYGTGLGGIPAYTGGLGGIGGIGGIPSYTGGIPAYGGLGGSYPIGGLPSTGYGYGEILTFHELKTLNHCFIMHPHLVVLSINLGRDENVSLTSTASTVDHRSSTSSTGRRRPS